MGESQGKAMKDHSPEQVRKYSKSHEANKYLYEEMAELL